MITYHFAIKRGHNATLPLYNLQTLTGLAPIATPVPLGTFKRVMDDSSVKYRGPKNIRWMFDAMSLAGFIALIEEGLGDFDTASGPVTIVTRKRNDAMALYNATMVQPQEERDFKRAYGGFGAVEGLGIDFLDLVAIGAFTDGFSVGFEV